MNKYNKIQSLNWTKALSKHFILYMYVCIHVYPNSQDTTIREIIAKMTIKFKRLSLPNIGKRLILCQEKLNECICFGSVC